MDSTVPKLLVLSFLVLAGLSAVTAQDSQWEFHPETELDPDRISVNTSSYFFTDLQTFEGDHISPDMIEGFEEGSTNLTESPYVLYEYEHLNHSTGETETRNESLNYHEEWEIWYTEFSTNHQGLEDITYRARGGLEDGGLPDSDGEANETVDVDVGEWIPELLTINAEEYTIDDPLKADRAINPNVELTDLDGNPQGEDVAEVEVFFRNQSESEEAYETLYSEEEEYFYNSEVRTPTATNETYLMRIEAEEQETGELEGAETLMVETAPAIQGETARLNTTQGCEEDQEIVERCEVGTDLHAELGITAAEAEGANISLSAFNESAEEEQVVEELEMNELEEEDFNTSEYLQYFESDLDIPDLNTSNWDLDETITVEMEAFSVDRTFTETHEIEVETFAVEDRTDPLADTGSSHEIRIRLGKAISLEPYDLERFQNITVDVEGPDFHENMTKDDLGYDPSNDLAVGEVFIPADAETTTYDIDIEATDIYNETKTDSSEFEVQEGDDTDVFDVTDQVTHNYLETGNFTEQIEVENLQEAMIEVEASTPSENITIINETMEVGGGETRELEYEIEMEEIEEFDTNITVEHQASDFNRTVDVSVETFDCGVRLDDLCVTREEINLVLDPQENYVEPVELENIGDSELQVNQSLEGNLTDTASVAESVEFNDTHTSTLDVEPRDEGNYTGDMIFEKNDLNGSIPVSVEVTGDYVPPQASMTVSPTTIELGTVAEGETITDSYDVEIENDGDLLLENISITGMGVLEEESELEVNESTELTVTPGTVDEVEDWTVQAESEEENPVETVEISADFIEDYSERADEIREDVRDLRPDVDDPNLEADLTDAENLADEIESLWDSGEYVEARDTFDDAQSIIADVEIQMGDDTNGDTNGQETEEQEDGGLPVLPILGVLLALLLIGGFVFYESYIPEEGDPLYGVLGDDTA